MSVPETNALPPLPRNVTTRTVRSFANARQRSRSSAHIACVNALWAVGLSNTIRATGPLLSRMIRPALILGEPPLRREATAFRSAHAEFRHRARLPRAADSGPAAGNHTTTTKNQKTKKNQQRDGEFPSPSGAP